MHNTLDISGIDLTTGEIIGLWIQSIMYYIFPVKVTCRDSKMMTFQIQAEQYSDLSQQYKQKLQEDKLLLLIAMCL